MRYAVFSVSLPEYTPEQAVQELRDAGYDGVEWRVVDQQPATQPGFWVGNRCTWPLSSFPEDAPRIRKLTQDAGLAMPSLGTYANSSDMQSVERAIVGAAKLGVAQLRINVPPYNTKDSYIAMRDQALDQYANVAALAKQYGVRALVEIHHNSLLPSASAAAAFLSHFDPQHVGAIHDAGNMVYEGHEQYRMGLEVLGPYLAHVHLKNAQWKLVGTRADGSSEWQATWAAISKGIVDMHALLRALHQVGYDGWLSFEDFSTDMPLAERLRGNIQYIRGVERDVKDEG